jgi:hypothetical protein
VHRGSLLQLEVSDVDAAAEGLRRKIEDCESVVGHQNACTRHYVLFGLPLPLKVVPVGVTRERGAELLELVPIHRVPERRRVAAGRRVRDDAEEDGRPHECGDAHGRARTRRNPVVVHGDVVHGRDHGRAPVLPHANVRALVAEEAEPSAVAVQHSAHRHLDCRGRDGAELPVRERVAGREPIGCELRRDVVSLVVTTKTRSVSHRGRFERQPVVDSVVARIRVVVPSWVSANTHINVWDVLTHHSH